MMPHYPTLRILCVQVHPELALWSLASSWISGKHLRPTSSRTKPDPLRGQDWQRTMAEIPRADLRHDPRARIRGSIRSQRRYAGLFFIAASISLATSLSTDSSVCSATSLKGPKRGAEIRDAELLVRKTWSVVERILMAGPVLKRMVEDRARYFVRKEIGARLPGNDR